jgi:hypothetical protein
MRVKIFPTVAAVTSLPVVETKNVRRAGPNRLRDSRSQPARTSATGLVSGSRRERLPLEVHVFGGQETGFPGPQPAGVHQCEERDCLPPPR